MLEPPREHPPNSIVFNGSPRPTLGIELELSLVDPQSRALIPVAPQVLAALRVPWAKHELFQTIVEVITDICDDVGQARRQLEQRLAVVRKAARSCGAELICTGTHPMSAWHRTPITDDPRYGALVDRMQWPAKRLLICGVHVHVGVPSGEHAVAIMNSLTCFVPHLLAASASSPFWLGRDTGLASSRAKVFEGLPTAGLPPHLTNWAEFVSMMHTLLGAGTIKSIREIWWDVRPHPDFGTVELRMMDGLNTLSEVASLAAFSQCLVVFLNQLYDRGGPMPVLKRWTLAENKWRATRYGEEGHIIRNEGGGTVRLSDHISEWLEYLLPIARELRCDRELAQVRRILTGGPCYRRQRQVYKDEGSLDAVVDMLIEELEQDRPWALK